MLVAPTHSRTELLSALLDSVGGLLFSRVEITDNCCDNDKAAVFLFCSAYTSQDLCLRMKPPPIQPLILGRSLLTFNNLVTYCGRLQVGAR
jgi:hypothetical protein